MTFPYKKKLLFHLVYEAEASVTLQGEIIFTVHLAGRKINLLDWIICEVIKSELQGTP